MDYRKNAPYPPIQVMGKNRSYAQTMLDNMGGRHSELSAVSLYFYNHLILDGCAEIAAGFHQISLVEMHHLEIFGKLARKLGADPRLWSGIDRPLYWSPSYNRYPRPLKELLQNALEGELTAIRKYQSQIDSIHDPGIVAQLRRIIEDENHHVAIFRTYLSGC